MEMRAQRPESTKDWYIQRKASGYTLQRRAVSQFGCYNKIPWTVWLKQWGFISHSSGYWKSKIRVPPWLGSGESPLCGSQAAVFFLYPHIAEKGRKRNHLCHVSSYKGTNPIMRTPPQNPTSKYHHIGASPCEFQGVMNIQSIAGRQRDWLEIGFK